MQLTSNSIFCGQALEGICFSLYDVLNAVENPAEPIEEVVISGGFISSPVWVQLLADVLGKKLVVMQSEDASAIGAIYLAMEALRFDFRSIQNKDAESRLVIHPNMENNKVYTQVFPVYKKLI
jgi:gluconokinase